MELQISPSTAKKLTLPLLNLLAALFLAGCADGNDNVIFYPYLSGCTDSQSCASNPPLEIDADRPAQAYIPSDYNTATKYPLVILLHGFGADGFVQSAYMGLPRRVDTHDYVLITPDGTVNATGSRYWNATPACCAGPDEAAQIDDVGYIRGLIEKAAATYSIDTHRIGLIGHSNGGYMALRMACEASDIVTSVVSLAGSTFEEASSCAPAAYPVSVLTMHGDDDETVSYDGGFGYPGALETIARFAALAECDTSNPLMPDNIDVDASIEGNETEILRYSGCSPGVDAELWTMVGSPHIPFPWEEAGMDSVVDWMTGHSRAN